MKTFKLIMALAFCVSLTNCKKKEVDPREVFLAVYQVHETYSTSFTGSKSRDYAVNISKSSIDGNKILINNFMNISGLSVFADISGSNITIPKQAFEDGRYHCEVSGIGTLNGIQLNYAYTLMEDGDVVNFSSTGIKK